MKLLNEENAKTPKGEQYGWKTGICYLAPAHESGVMNTCQNASPECMKYCLFFQGRPTIFPHIIPARIRRTQWLFEDREAFLGQLRKDIEALARKAEREGMKPAIRVNGTSDLAWIGMQMAKEYPSIQFYDYTKLPKPWLRTLPNYHITFSLSELNHDHAIEALQHGVNVAVVFDTPKGKPLPATWEGYRVIDGDEHDLRFLDEPGCVVGLRAKGSLRKAKSPFVQIARNPVVWNRALANAQVV